MHSHKLDNLIEVINDTDAIKAPLTSQSSQLLVDLTWPASPEQFSLLGSQGTLGFSFDDGKFLSASSSQKAFLS